MARMEPITATVSIQIVGQSCIECGDPATEYEIRHLCNRHGSGRTVYLSGYHAGWQAAQQQQDAGDGASNE